MKAKIKNNKVIIPIKGNYPILLLDWLSGTKENGAETIKMARMYRQEKGKIVESHYEVEGLKNAKQFVDFINECYIGDEDKNQYFEITSIHRDDLKSKGFITKGVDDSTMKTLATKMSDDYHEQLYWEQMITIAESLGIKRKKRLNENEQ